MTETRPVYAGIEGGGTKFICALGTAPDDLIDETRFATTTPDDTLRQVGEFLSRPRDGVRIAAVGVASFGPIDLDTSSSTYGFITTTPS